MLLDEKHGVGTGNVLNALCEMNKFVCVAVAVDPCFEWFGCLMR